MDMKRKTLLGCMILALVFCATSLAMAAEVSQGKCVSYNKNENVVTIDEYNLNFSKENPYGEPTGTISTYSLAGAQIGIPPEPGDIIRIAYVVQGTDRVALKVMNVSKQDLRKK